MKTQRRNFIMEIGKRPRDEYEIREDMRTLERARQIRKDPARLKDVQNMIKEQRIAQNEILGMTTAGNNRRANPATRGSRPVPE
jgi:hypothetical protein